LGGTKKPMYITIPGLDDGITLKAIFTTRFGGVSSPPYDTLNLSFQRDDDRNNVIENYRLLSNETGIPPDHMVLTWQVHGDKISMVDKSHCGMGLVREHELGYTDGLITAEKNIALVTIHADCVPVYLYDPVNSVIALVHSGWRGTLLNIAAKAIKLMKGRYNCKAGNIIAAVGPHIRKCCFEVRNDVYDIFLEKFPYYSYLFEPYGNNYRIDLEGIITRTLIAEGLDTRNIHDIKRCTVCEKGLFFSHRGGHGNTGAGAAVLMMVG
jgi:YfiH family protein